MISFIRSWFNKKSCRHEFKLADLSKTGVNPPEKPIGKDYKEWDAYLTDLWHGQWRNHVVRWPCHKCGEVFEAFCGLDISSRHGRIVE